ncbi:MAG: helix-turn-helix transcriptional regulator, partial [Enterococcus sp.]|nr:helix-turn-helix transcriptional regulator [Enterococcus sp.]
ALTYSYRLDRSEWFATYQKDIAKEQAVTALLLTENEERTFTNLIKLGNKELLTQAINESFKRIKEQHVPLKYYQVYLLEHVTLLLKIAHSYSFEPMDVFGEDLLKMVEDLQKVSLEEMTRWFLTKSQQLNEKIQWSTADSGKAVIQKAKLLVKEQYSDPELTIEKMSQALFLSPAYFSSLFKKETGQSFISFLTEERLQQARQLMETTNDKSYVVAEKVGYSEPNYFSYVFKKRFGLSPSKYRNQMAKV